MKNIKDIYLGLSSPDTEVIKFLQSLSILDSDGNLIGHEKESAYAHGFNLQKYLKLDTNGFIDLIKPKGFIKSNIKVLRSFLDMPPSNYDFYKIQKEFCYDSVNDPLLKVERPAGVDMITNDELFSGSASLDKNYNMISKFLYDLRNNRLSKNSRTNLINIIKILAQHNEISNYALMICLYCEYSLYNRKSGKLKASNLAKSLFLFEDKNILIKNILRLVKNYDTAILHNNYFDLDRNEYSKLIQAFIDKCKFYSSGTMREIMVNLESNAGRANTIKLLEYNDFQLIKTMLTKSNSYGHYIPEYILSNKNFWTRLNSNMVYNILYCTGRHLKSDQQSRIKEWSSHVHSSLSRDQLEQLNLSPQKKNTLKKNTDSIVSGNSNSYPEYNFVYAPRGQSFSDWLDQARPGLNQHQHQAGSPSRVESLARPSHTWLAEEVEGSISDPFEL